MEGILWNRLALLLLLPVYKINKMYRSAPLKAELEKNPAKLITPVTCPIIEAALIYNFGRHFSFHSISLGIL